MLNYFSVFTRSVHTIILQTMWISLFIYYNFPLGKQLFIKIDSHKEILSSFLKIG